MHTYGYMCNVLWYQKHLLAVGQKSWEGPAVAAFGTEELKNMFFFKKSYYL